MPSSPGYVRDIKQEYKTAKARGEKAAGTSGPDAKRHKLRREMVAKGKVKSGQDVDHKKPLSKGGANTVANARAVSPSTNRSFSRNPDGSMKANDGATRRSKGK